MTVRTELLVAAREEADVAARKSGVRVVGLHDAGEVDRIAEVVEAVWGSAVRPTPDILRALARAGGTLLAAEPENDPGHTVGCALGFLGWDGGVHLHSHQVGIVADYRRGGVGYALKLAQRAACLEHGITEMRWTFDPLIARNAAFNFGRLGTVGAHFLPDFYGTMTDDINAGDASDRFEVSWQLDRALTGRVDSGGRDVLLATDEAGLPYRTDVAVAAGVRVPVPADYPALREAGDPTATAWRHAVRAAFSECFSAGLIAVAFGPDGYLFDTETTVYARYGSTNPDKGTAEAALPRVNS